MSDLSFPRIGQSFDAHRFVLGEAPDLAPRPLQLCCLTWPGEPALDGHSDGDVAAHALAESMLVAAGMGDMGTVFGTADPAYAAAGGQVFIARARQLIEEAGWRLGNACVQVIGVRPRLSSRREEAESRLSELAGGSVMVSATTTDSMGFTGRGEGLAAAATCLLFVA